MGKVTGVGQGIQEYEYAAESYRNMAEALKPGKKYYTSGKKKYSK